MRYLKPSARGFSLIEALVALLVMGFGMLGMLGIQSALRQYSDISKQRSEAVRLSQDAIENWRAFVKLGADAGAIDYAEIVPDAGFFDVTGRLPGPTNTTFEMFRNVDTLPETADFPQRGKWVRLDLRWNDRAGAQQTVSFFTHVTGVSPELGGTLVSPPAGGKSPTRRPLGRHAGIPRGAIDNGDGTSSFPRPDMPGTKWQFDNVSGEIIKVCAPACTDFVGYLLTGYVRFTDPVKVIPPDLPPPGPKQPGPSDAEFPAAPSSTFGSIGVSVLQSVPASLAGTVVCATETFAFHVVYYCAVPVTLAEKRWAGYSYITGPVAAADASDPTVGLVRVCRYTPAASHIAENVDHPLNYGADGPDPGTDPDYVTQTLFNQNFLVMRAGDGTTPFVCPGDDSATPFVNGNTFAHQPPT